MKIESLNSSVGTPMKKLMVRGNRLFRANQNLHCSPGCPAVSDDRRLRMVLHYAGPGSSYFQLLC